MSPTGTILVVDENQALQTVYADVFTRYRLVFAAEGSAAIHQLWAEKPDLVILDLTLHDIDGLLLIPKIRRSSNVPIFICSGRQGQADRVLGLQAGADDFLGKPFDIDELEARVEAVLRRSVHAPEPATRTRFGRLNITAARGATIDGRPFPLSPIEYRLLVELVFHAGDVTSRAELARAGWNYEACDAGTEHIIAVHVGRLRRRLQAMGEGLPNILTVRGTGYRMVG